MRTAYFVLNINCTFVIQKASGGSAEEHSKLDTV